MVNIIYQMLGKFHLNSDVVYDVLIVFGDIVVSYTAFFHSILSLRLESVDLFPFRVNMMFARYCNGNKCKKLKSKTKSTEEMP